MVTSKVTDTLWCSITWCSQLCSKWQDRVEGGGHHVYCNSGGSSSANWPCQTPVRLLGQSVILLVLWSWGPGFDSRVGQDICIYCLFSVLLAPCVSLAPDVGLEPTTLYSPHAFQYECVCIRELAYKFRSCEGKYCVFACKSYCKSSCKSYCWIVHNFKWQFQIFDLLIKIMFTIWPW